MMLFRVKPLFLAAAVVAAGGCGTDDESSSSSSSGGASVEAAETLNLAVGTGVGDSFQEGSMETDIDELSAGGSTRLSFNIVNKDENNSLYSGDPVTIEFSSPCLSASNAASELDGPLQFETGSGDVSVRYTAEGCSGEDAVTARVLENSDDEGAEVSFSTNEASTVLDIAEPTDLSISSSTPDPESLAPRNSQSDVRGSISEVSFTVLGEGGSQVPNQDVNFELQYEGSDATGDGAPKLEEDAQTSSGSGQVRARVQAGTGNAIVRVIAKLASDESVATASPPIAVNRSVPTQEAFSMSVSDALPNAWDVDGETSEITIRAADNWGNNSGNAIVNFVTSGGSIEGDCVLDDNGECTVTWRSQNPRPNDARVTIMARTVGEESFTDEDGDRQFDQGEPFVESLGEAYLDSDQSGTFSGGDDLFDQNGNGAWDGPNGEYSGSGCPAGSDFCTRDPVTVWEDTTGFWMASDDLTITINGPGGDGEYCAQVQGQTGNGNQTPPPSGTSINFEFDGDGGITSSITDMTVSSQPTSDDFAELCVDVEGPGTLNAVAEPPGGEKPVEAFQTL